MQLLFMMTQFTKYTRFLIDWVRSYMKKKKIKEHNEHLSGLFNQEKESEANKANQLDTPQVHLYHIHWFPYMNHCQLIFPSCTL